MKLSEHFSLAEFIISKKAEELNIDNTPSAEVINNLSILCKTVLEPLRGILGKPIHILSGYRCEQLNRAVGGSANSQHLVGQAADIRCYNYTPEEMIMIIFNNRNKLSFGQAIAENVRGKNWLHISSGTKKETMIAYEQNGKVVYEQLNLG